MRWTSVISGIVLLLGLTTGCACDAFGNSGNDGGPSDGGSTDRGGPIDGGDPDGADPDVDPIADLDPIDPQCEDFQGSADDCWKEWLKIMGDPEFDPVERGELGAGPWPTDALVTWGNPEGLSGNILFVGTDTGQNVYAVSREALFIRRSGAARFERYDRGTHGIRDYPLMSVAGQAPGVAFLGLEGYYGSLYEESVRQNDPWIEEEEARLSGDVMRIDLIPGGIRTTRLRTHNSNTPTSGKYDHTRQIYNIVIPRRGPAAGEVFLGTEHGAVRYQGEYYADHVHIDTNILLPDGRTTQRFGPAEAIHVTDSGVMWFGNDFQFGARPFTWRLAEWYDERWLFPSYGFGTREDRDYYRGIGIDSNGVVWAGARTFGLARLHTRDGGRVEQVSVPNSAIRDVVVDLDDSVWLATDGGLFRRDPASGSWDRLAGVPGTVFDLFLDDTVEPRALYIGHSGGMSVYRGE